MELHFTNQLFGNEDFQDIFREFDFDLLNDSKFKEDSVREEIIFPLLKALGYSASSKNKVIRSKNLKHPFNYFGTKKYNVNIIPDYTFEIGNDVKWVLDAKRPTENIDDIKNIYQAYSYAVHPEIQSELFALCNGRTLSVFNIKKHTPILKFDIIDLEKNWNLLKKTLSPEFVLKPLLKEFRPDFGLHLLKIMDSSAHFNDHMFPLDRIFFIAKIEENLYSLNSIYKMQGFGTQEFLGTFDFDEMQYMTLLSLLPTDLKTEIQATLSRQPFRWVDQNGKDCAVSIIAQIGSEINTNENESYLPFVVTKFVEKG